MLMPTLEPKWLRYEDEDEDDDDDYNEDDDGGGGDDDDDDEDDEDEDDDYDDDDDCDLRFGNSRVLNLTPHCNPNKKQHLSGFKEAVSHSCWCCR